MKNIFRIIVKKRTIVKIDQRALLDFVNDTENIKKAAHGSMEKRLKLIEQATQAQTA